MEERSESGLLGLGSSGQWHIDIDETTKGNITMYFIVFKRAPVTLQFGVININILHDLYSFLNNNTSSRFSEYSIEGCLNGTLYFILGDDRLFIKQTAINAVGETEMFEIYFDENEKLKLTEALHEAISEL